ncbi:hypothetical protein A2U01_0077566, partial [Trifolium medium]|nr:hypothetical protein [Trifolium medium]
MLHLGAQSALEFDTLVILSFRGIVIWTENTQRFKLCRILRDSHVSLFKLQEFYNFPVPHISRKILHPELPLE